MEFSIIAVARMWRMCWLFYEHVKTTQSTVKQVRTNTNVDDVASPDRVRRLLVDRRAPITLKI